MERNRRSEGLRGRRASGPRGRLFVALELPEAARRELAAWRDSLVAGRDDLRPVAPQALHVTLVFLGWQAERDAGRIAESARRAAEGLPAARLAPVAVEPIPPRGPRLFALDLADEHDRCAGAQAAIARALEADGFYRPEKRPFWSHVTLARVKRGRRASPLEAEELPPPFEARRITLYRSTLRPHGAVYEPLGGFELSS